MLMSGLRNRGPSHRSRRCGRMACRRPIRLASDRPAGTRRGDFIHRSKSGQLGDELQIFSFRPSPRGAGVDIAHRAERKREFGEVVAVCRFHEGNEIVLNGGKIDLLDLDPSWEDDPMLFMISMKFTEQGIRTI